MATIHVKAKFHFSPPDGSDAIVFAIGTHTNVAKEIANHPFVKAHCTDMPIEENDKGGAAALALLTERDVQIGELAEQLAAANVHISALLKGTDNLRALGDALTAERDDARALLETQTGQIAALTTEREALANQVAELQAGGTPSTKKKN